MELGKNGKNGRSKTQTQTFQYPLQPSIQPTFVYRSYMLHPPVLGLCMKMNLGASQINTPIYMFDMDDWITLYKNGGYAGLGSGSGSILHNNWTLIYWLNGFMDACRIFRILDVGCGDMQWMPFVNLSKRHYLGIDYVDYLIDDNRRNFPHLNFECMNILSETFRMDKSFDLVFCKDVFHHCSPKEKEILLHNIRGIKTTFKIMVVPFTHPVSNSKFLFEYQSDERKQVYSL